MKYLFGPVPSRRLGRSLGVDIVPYKTCSLDCLYCECGPTTEHTSLRFSRVPEQEVMEEIRSFFRRNIPLDYITFSGSGEPTLHSGLGRMLKEIKNISSVPRAVLTNSTLMPDPGVRKELSFSDLVIPSLDAVSPDIFRKIDRPLPGMDINAIIEGLISFRKEFRGQIWLEILFVSGINTSMEELKKFRTVIKKISPDRLQLNSVDRPPAVEGSEPVGIDFLKMAGAFLEQEHTDIVSRTVAGHRTETEPVFRSKDILKILKRRPCTQEDFLKVLDVDKKSLVLLLEEMEKERKIKKEDSAGQTFYEIFRKGENG